MDTDGFIEFLIVVLLVIVFFAALLTCKGIEKINTTIEMIEELGKEQDERYETQGKINEHILDIIEVNDYGKCS